MLQPEANDIDEQDIAAKKYQLFDAMGIMQHHDAITGTEN